jgi:hypothetical protein
MALESLLFTVPAVLAGAAVVNGILEARHGLRAKQRARHALQHTSDARVLRYIKEFQNRNLTDAELADAADVITNSLTELSEGDRKYINRGIRQPSRSGERRFIQDITGSG